MNKNTQNLLKLQIFLKYLYMCVYICSIYIYIYIYIYAHIHVGYCSQSFMNQLNSQFKSINLKLNASVYSNGISLAYTYHDAGFDTTFL